MSGIPKQLPWRDFVAVLRKLGYEPTKNNRGASRSFYCATANPPIVTFHEPHGGKTIAHGTLRENIRKLKLTPDKFLELLN